MKNENDILSKIQPDMPAGPYLLGYAQAVRDLNKDWDVFRREAAKEMLPLTATFKITKGDTLIRTIPMKAAVKTAIEYADELIRQLREDKK